MSTKKSNVDFNVISRRSRCLKSVSESLNVEKRFENLSIKLSSYKKGQNNTSIKTSLNTFLESICNSSDASKYFRQPLYIIQEFNKTDTDISNYVLQEYVSRIIPCINDLSKMRESLERYTLLDEQKESILEAAAKYTIADRILKNHTVLSEKFNIELEVTKINSKGLGNVIESCCSLVDNYSIPSYQKLNLCIEEMTYLLGKHGVDYDKKDLVYYISNYFLLNCPEDLSGYKKALTESYCLDKKDLSAVNFLFTESENNYISIKGEINKYLKSDKKDDPETLSIMFRSCIENCSLEDLIFNIDKLVWLLWDIYRFHIIDDDNIKELYPYLLDLIVRRCTDSINKSLTSMSKGDIETVLKKIINVRKIIVTKNGDDREYIETACTFREIISDCTEKLASVLNVIYYESNLEAIKFVNSSDSEILPLKEFKIFKFNNLLKAAINLNKYLKDKSSKLFKTVSKKNKIHIFKEGKDIYSYIGEDCRADICVAQYFIDESCIDETVKELEEICKDFNNKLQCSNNYSTKCYYIVNPGIIEIHVKESTFINSEDIEWDKVFSSENNDLDIYIEELANIETCLEVYELLSENDSVEIKDKLAEFYKNPNLSVDHFKVALEALSFLNISKEDIDIFAERFMNYRYNYINENSLGDQFVYNKESRLINEASNNWAHENDVPIDIQLEAYQILCAILEDAPEVKKPEVKKPKVGSSNDNKNKNSIENKEDPKNRDDKENSEEFRKNPFKGININSMKLYLEGLKSKLKNMSQKEKEVSRNLDNNFRRFSKAMHDALISDRREAIIKGSVIPSFSKCIKIAIGLAGTGLISGNPLVPLLIAIGGFAVSKRITKKERILLLDEIETELDVVEKEIAMAESKNQMKKYRTLLKYKKDLQRQYQRIRYNVRVGKDILPGSASGMKQN